METQDKKKEILSAASTCFARYGYEKTTLDDIGKLVGLNKASLYYYYKNKESIYTEVIFYEANEFMMSVFHEVNQVQGCKEKILTYLNARLKYMRETTNMNQLTLDSVQKLLPLFTDMYNKIVEKEANYLAGILEGCVVEGEMIPCDTNRVAGSIITVTEAIKNRLDSCRNVSLESTYLAALDEITFTVSLILDGLKKNNSVYRR